MKNSGKTMIAVIVVVMLFLSGALGAWIIGNDRSSDSGKDKSVEKETESESVVEKEKKEESTSGKPEDNNKKENNEAYRGALKVSGTKLVDENGDTVQLKGLSTHGIAWFPDYINQDCFRQLHEDFGINVIRLAMYTSEYNGYCSGGNQTDLKEMINRGVSYAADNDMYAIIDWHTLSDNNPNTYVEQSKEFFDEMSEKYKDSDNVIYEICNEPNGGTTWDEIKAYAEQVIKVIRDNDKDGVILVGTPNWSQYVDEASASPIEGYENIMYTLHFYAGTHKDDLRAKMQSALDSGLPVFVSEFGICDASGNGAIDEAEAGKWIEAMNNNDVSYVMWNISNKDETSAIFKSSCDKHSGFTEYDLSDSGKWFLNIMKGRLNSDKIYNNNNDSGENDSGNEKDETTANVEVKHLTDVGFIVESKDGLKLKNKTGVNV